MKVLLQGRKRGSNYNYIVRHVSTLTKKASAGTINILLERVIYHVVC